MKLDKKRDLQDWLTKLKFMKDNFKMMQRMGGAEKLIILAIIEKENLEMDTFKMGRNMIKMEILSKID